MALLVYSRECVECKLRREMRLLSDFASQNRLRVVSRRTLFSRKTMDEAERITDVTQPFVYNEETRTAIYLPDVQPKDLLRLL